MVLMGFALSYYRWPTRDSFGWFIWCGWAAVPPGQPLQQIRLGITSSESGGQLGPFITLLDAKLIILDHETASQFFSWAAVLNYCKNWPIFGVFGLDQAGTTCDCPITWDIHALVSIVFLQKIRSQTNEKRGLQGRMTKGPYSGQRTLHTL